MFCNHVNWVAGHKCKIIILLAFRTIPVPSQGFRFIVPGIQCETICTYMQLSNCQSFFVHPQAVGSRNIIQNQYINIIQNQNIMQ